MNGQLFPRDWRALLDAVYRINQSNDVSTLEEKSLECIRHLIPCTQATFFIVEGAVQGADSDLSNIAYRRPVVAGMQALYLEEFSSGKFDSDPYFGGLGIISSTATLRDTDLMPEDYRIRTPLYQQIYAKQGIHFGLRSYLAHAGTLIGNISLFNTKEAGDFTDKSMAMLDTLAPHVALRLHELLGDEAHGEHAAKYALDFAIFAQMGLTSREQEIARLVASGRDDRDIADELCISFATFKKHISNIYRKAGVSNRVQLFALLQG